MIPYSLSGAIPMSTTRRHAWKNSRSDNLPPPVPGARWIPISNLRFVLVDDCDYEWLSGYNWTSKTHRRSTYCYVTRRVEGRRVQFLIHRVIMNARPGVEIDHIDGDGLNCRRSNLRECTHIENHRNLRTHVGPKTSQFKGVYYEKRRCGWVAKITIRYQTHYLGCFESEELAAVAYDAAATKAFGEFSRPNFK